SPRDATPSDATPSDATLGDALPTGTRETADAAARAPIAPDSQWELWEVFTQEAQGAPHEHAGSVRATDAAHAIQNARDVYGRRGRVLSMWVVPTSAIAATSPDDAEPFFDPAADKPYRHPHFYKVPRGVRGV
ncbi:MAG TPA: 1,2-phenylacetyl-CoA epoxidase subunit PaaB, partial [Gemmatirosa sp.]